MCYNNCDELFTEAGKLIIEKNKASTALLQRYFHIGYVRADRIMGQLAEAGVVTVEVADNSRKILMTMEQFKNLIGDKYVSEQENTELSQLRETNKKTGSGSIKKDSFPSKSMKKLLTMVGILGIAVLVMFSCIRNTDTVSKQLSRAVESGHLNTENFEFTFDSLTGEGTVKVTTDGTLEVKDEAYFANRYIPADGYYAYTAGGIKYTEYLTVYYMGQSNVYGEDHTVQVYSYQTSTPDLLTGNYQRTDYVLLQELDGGEVYKAKSVDDDFEMYMANPGESRVSFNDPNKTKTVLDTSFTVETPLGSYNNCCGILTADKWSDGTTHYTLDLYAPNDYPDSGRTVTLFNTDDGLYLHEERAEVSLFSSGETYNTDTTTESTVEEKDEELVATDKTYTSLNGCPVNKCWSNTIELGNGWTVYIPESWVGNCYMEDASDLGWVTFYEAANFEENYVKGNENSENYYMDGMLCSVDFMWSTSSRITVDDLVDYGIYKAIAVDINEEYNAYSGVVVKYPQEAHFTEELSDAYNELSRELAIVDVYSEDDYFFVTDEYMFVEMLNLNFN